MKIKYLLLGFACIIGMYMYIQLHMALLDMMNPDDKSMGVSISMTYVAIFVFVGIIILAGRSFYKAFEKTELFKD